MAYELPSFTTESNITLTNAYVFIHDMMVSFARGEGHLTYGIHPAQDAWTSKPAETVLVSLGEKFENGEQMPSYEEFISDPEVAQAMEVIGLKLYTITKQKHPRFQQATIIPR